MDGLLPDVKVQVDLAAFESLEQRALLALAVDGLRLIDASTDLPLVDFDLINHATLDLAETGRRLNLRAVVSGGDATGVRFNLDGRPDYAIDRSDPFTIAGERRRAGRLDYHPWMPTLGTHTLIVTPYSGPDGAGTRGRSHTVTFRVIDSSAPAPPVRVNVGGGEYTTAGGSHFSADASGTRVRGGPARSGTFPIANSFDDLLYQSWRRGSSLRFSVPVPDGTYSVTLHFVETRFGEPGRRIFDVRAEDQTFLENLDVVAEAGFRSALTRTFRVVVEDGRLDLTLDATVGKAILSALQLTADRAPQAPEPLRVNAGGGAYEDQYARHFDADEGFVGGFEGHTPYEIEYEPDSILFNTYREGGHFQFSRPVANGNYALWLEFAEPTLTGPGQRLFDVSIEGKPAVDDLDLFAAAGWRTPLVRGFDVRVSDGTIDLSFDASVGQAMVSALALVPTDVPEGFRAYDSACLSELEKESLGRENLRWIGGSLFLYANDHKGRFPGDLATVTGISGLHKVFASPRSATLLPRGELSPLEQQAWVAARSDYIYRPGHTASSPAEVIIVYENPTRVAGPLHLLFNDGTVRLVERAEAADLLGMALPDPVDAPPPVDSGLSQCARDPAIIESQENLTTILQAATRFARRNRNEFPRELGALHQSPFGLMPQTLINPRGTTTFPDGLSAEQIREWINNSTDYVYSAPGVPAVGYPFIVVAHESQAEMSDGISLISGAAEIAYVEMRWAMEKIERSVKWRSQN